MAVLSLPKTQVEPVFWACSTLPPPDAIAAAGPFVSRLAEFIPQTDTLLAHTAEVCGPYYSLHFIHLYLYICVDATLCCFAGEYRPIRYLRTRLRRDLRRFPGSTFVINNSTGGAGSSAAVLCATSASAGKQIVALIIMANVSKNAAPVHQNSV